MPPYLPCIQRDRTITWSATRPTLTAHHTPRTPHPTANRRLG